MEPVLPMVDASPLWAVAVEAPPLPGACGGVRSVRLTEVQARRLAAAVNAAPDSAFNHGTYSCPAESGAVDLVSFNVAAGWQVLIVRLDGCPGIQGVGTLARTLTRRVLAELHRDGVATAPAHL
ncbi:hypothetical protein [Motilibacter rhizosphaerae]|nr:hypothetical protein [Motilibacter rhizosphaerae]